MTTFELLLLSVFIACLGMYWAVCGAQWLARELWLKVTSPSRWDGFLQKLVEGLEQRRQVLAGVTVTLLAAFLTAFLAIRLMRLLVQYV